MTVLWVILGILLFFFILLHSPLNIALSYQEGFSVRIKYWFITIPVFPSKKPKKPKKKKPKEEKKDKKEKKPNAIKRLLNEQGLPAVVGLFKELARLAGQAVVKLGRGIRVRDLYLDMIVAGEDAAETATTYGKTCAEIYSALGVLMNLLSVRVKAFSIIPDFSEGAKTSIDLAANVRVTPAFLIRTGCGLFFRFLVILIKANVFKSSGGKRSEKAGEESAESTTKNEKAVQKDE